MFIIVMVCCFVLATQIYLLFSFEIFVDAPSEIALSLNYFILIAYMSQVVASRIDIL